jgi:hypothetical protein
VVRYVPETEKKNRDSQSTSERVSFLGWSSRSGETIFLFLARF